MLLSLLITTSALAQDCDGAALSKDILELGPHEAAPAYVQLAACDAGAAKKVASKVVPSLIGETDGFAAAVAVHRGGCRIIGHGLDGNLAARRAVSRRSRLR